MAVGLDPGLIVCAGANDRQQKVEEEERQINTKSKNIISKAEDFESNH